MARFCNQCNYPIEEGGNFCTECGSSDIRDDTIQPQPNIKEDIVENTSNTNTPIPEMTTNSVRSFGDQSMEQLQNSTIEPINNAPINAPNNTMVQPTHTFVESQNTSMNSFADVPDRMNGTQQINIPADFQLQEGSANDYAQQAYASQTAARNMQRRKIKKKKDSTILKVVIAIIGIMVFFFMLVFVYSYGKSAGSSGDPFSNRDISSTGNQNGNTDYTKIFTQENSFRVGDQSVGFVSIPKTWAQVTQQEGSNVHQYTDGSTWVVTLMAASTSETSAVTYANNVYHSIKEGGGQNITTGKTAIAGYPALTITASYPSLNKYLTTWCFESKIGKTHYLAIEGPSPSGDNYNIIYSFKEDK